ncbi:hypothetical protein BVRB_4g075240 [Beta vulgaris subsp. vulgaris]|nr:hypothetical protein BVRB_4g075240 [Beta vulgaris subsp. vulgaris]
MGVLESAGTPEFSSTMTSHEDDEKDAATQRNFVIAHECENEPALKRRKKDSCFVETIFGSRAVREPTVVLQSESDLDIHDDGYRWRKYGKKKPNFLGNISSGTPVYPMKFPAPPNCTPYGPLDLSSQHPAYASTIIPDLPDISFPLPLGFSRSVASYCNPDILHSSVQSMYPGPQLKQNDVQLLSLCKSGRTIHSLRQNCIPLTTQILHLQYTTMSLEHFRLECSSAPYDHH